eukprot:4121084-Pleurochrysis_carterae.AAC.1
MHKAAKHGGVVGNVRSSHRVRVEDASDKLEVGLALLDRAVGLSSCNAELAESLSRWALSVNQAGVVVDLRSVLLGRKRSAIFSM